MNARSFYQVTRQVLMATCAVVVFIAACPFTAQARVERRDSVRLSPENFNADLVGNYLSARLASQNRDVIAAADYWRAALAGDPANGYLLERAFLSSLAVGNTDYSISLAERLSAKDPSHRLARLALGVRDFKARRYANARRELQLAARAPVEDLTATLMIAWAFQAVGDTDKALEAIDKLKGPDGYTFFKAYHAALICDLAGRHQQAHDFIQKALDIDSTTARLVDAAVRIEARANKVDEAKRKLDGFLQQSPDHPLLRDAMVQLAAKKPFAPVVMNAAHGAAEVLFGIGSAIGRDGREEVAAGYLEFSLFLRPDDAVTLVALGDLFDSLKQYERANAIFSRLPLSAPLRPSAEIQMAINEDHLGRTEEAIKRLRTLVAARPDDLEAAQALGNVLRLKKRYNEAADIYSAALSRIKDVGRQHWSLFYYRGIAFERIKQWPKAEADFKKALELEPHHPLVLNYLGYSWIDQNLHLDQALDMVKKAVELRPSDGYIVDSLGWAFYRLGKYEDAVRELEKAIELKPEDPVINDHLGDAYWKVGRELEARFQWGHARDLKPEPEDLEKIEKKLKYGLDAVTNTSPATANGAMPPKVETPKNGG